VCPSTVDPIDLCAPSWQDDTCGSGVLRRHSRRSRIRVEGGMMDDLTGSATERIGQLQAVDARRRDAAWLERQLNSALEGWQSTEDELREIREAREDF